MLAQKQHNLNELNPPAGRAQEPSGTLLRPPAKTVQNHAHTRPIIPVVEKEKNLFKHVLASLRFFIIFLCFLTALYLVLRLMLDNNNSDLWYAPVLLALLVVTVLIGRPNPIWPPRWEKILIGFSLVILVPMLTISLVFGRLDMIVFFAHWNLGVEGTPIGPLILPTLNAVIFAVVIYAGYGLLFRQLRHVRIAGVLLAGVLLYCNPLLPELAYLLGGGAPRKQHWRIV